jgi:hypothetical protein
MGGLEGRGEVENLGFNGVPRISSGEISGAWTRQFLGKIDGGNHRGGCGGLIGTAYVESGKV